VTSAVRPGVAAGLHILIATDAFPPTCGGSGWSTYELARGLRRRGHRVTIVQPQRAGRVDPPAYDGFAVVGYPASAPPVPFVRNYVRNERLYARLARFLQAIIRRDGVDLVHGQHLLTVPAAIRAAHAEGVPVVSTIRDYWPICYWGDLLRDFGDDGVCPGCSAAAMTACVRPHAGPAWPLALPWIPYMRSNLRLKQGDLSRSDAVVAVSRSMARDLVSRAPALAATRVETIPNAVDIGAVRATVAGVPAPMAGPYALYVGKLAQNKGVGALIEVVRQARLGMPLVVVGDGPARAWLETEVARAGADVRLIGWASRDVVFQWMQHACLMIFPSGWREPLSRVLIEASTLGVPIAAMATGGTEDIVDDGETGLLAHSAGELAAAVARLAGDRALRARLGAAAARRAESTFDASVVVDRMEALYRDVLAAFHARHRGRA
jgi:glycogen synthase